MKKVLALLMLLFVVPAYGFEIGPIPLTADEKAAISGGAFNGTIGGTTPAAGTFTDLAATDTTLTGTLGSNEAAMAGDCTASVPWTLGAQWTCTGGVATKAGAGTSTLSQTTTAIEVNKWYKLTASVTVSAGTLTPSAGGETMAAISATNASYVSYFHATATTTLTFTPSNDFAGTVTATTLQEVGSSATFNDVQIMTSNTKQPLMFHRTLNSATGNETAYYFSYQTDKATSGNDTGMVISQIDTASPGTSKLISGVVGGIERFYVSAGATYVSSAFYNTDITPNSAVELSLNRNDSSTADSFRVKLASGTITSTSGSGGAVRILPIYNQASGTAANTDLLINRTETALGSGAQRLISAGTGGGTYTEKWGVDNAGQMVQTATSSPASNAACTAGTFYWDANYIYICTATGVVKRAALTGGY